MTSQGSFGARLREERERLDLSQQHCADVAGVGLSTWKRWEKDQAMPSDKMERLAAIGFDGDFLLTGNRDRDRAKVSAEEALMRVLDALEQLGLAKTLTLDQLKPLIGFAFSDRSSVEELKEVIRVGWAMKGLHLPKQ